MHPSGTATTCRPGPRFGNQKCYSNRGVGIRPGDRGSGPRRGPPRPRRSPSSDPKSLSNRSPRLAGPPRLCSLEAVGGPPGAPRGTRRLPRSPPPGGAGVRAMNWDRAFRLIHARASARASPPAPARGRHRWAPSARSRSASRAARAAPASRSCSASLAPCSPQRGRTLIVDADMGVGNAHILQDVCPEHSFVDRGRGALSVRDIVTPCAPSLDLLAAGSGVSRMAGALAGSCTSSPSGIERDRARATRTCSSTRPRASRTRRRLRRGQRRRAARHDARRHRDDGRVRLPEGAAAAARRARNPCSSSNRAHDAPQERLARRRAHGRPWRASSWAASRAGSAACPRTARSCACVNARVPVVVHAPAQRRRARAARGLRA